MCSSLSTPSFSVIKGTFASNFLFDSLVFDFVTLSFLLLTPFACSFRFLSQGFQPQEQVLAPVYPVDALVISRNCESLCLFA